MKIALVPLNPIVGDVNHNTSKILEYIDRAVDADCQLIVFPEMALIGYPPKDYLYYDVLMRQQSKALVHIKRKSRRITIIVGGIAPNHKHGHALKNVAYILQNGQSYIYEKQLLPNYDVFDECRYFEPGNKPLRIKIGGKWFGLSICEDIWASENKLDKKYPNDPLDRYRHLKIDFLINISASPFETNKQQRREKLLSQVAKRTKTPLLYLNQSGANDDLVFDGGAFLYDKKGMLIRSFPSFEENLFIYDDSISIAPSKPNLSISPIEALKLALVNGIRDYVHKTGFHDVVLGLSGGVDSALVAALAVEALGSDHVTCVMMPSRYSSVGSLEDAQLLIDRLQCRALTVPINELHGAFDNLFHQIFAGKTQDITSQNIQARIRGAILMAISNNNNCLLLNTTNKSEMAMGYGTLYGDMCGALAVISDVTKTQVYELCDHINKPNTIIPESILTKAPSAELKPNQKDSDSLPPYDLLDKLVEDFVDHQKITTPLESTGISSRRKMQTILRNEYKRRQAPIGIKISEKSFGSGRRFPVAGNLRLED